ncbi:MAG: c-type cytochrome [Hyphomicrobium sp.]|nr:c-type cytochrome [Hyphomicrobium sp.]
MNRRLTTSAAVACGIAMFALTNAPSSHADDAKMTTLERVKATAKGELKNPISISPEIIDEGKTLYQQKTCSACHGADGRGIHCPSVVNDAWVYGGDDDTLFRLIALGSEDLGKGGYSRGDKEIIAGPMPGFGEAIQDETDLWKIIAYIRSVSAAK